jgi:hypothetical protein
MESWRDETREALMRLKEPTKCHLWHIKEPSYLDVGNLKKYRVFIESDHFDREIRRCKFCGQLYYYEFREVNYTIDPDEPIYCTYIPIDDDPMLIEKLNSMSSDGLLCVTPRLQQDTGYPWALWKGRPEQPEDKDFRHGPKAPWEDPEQLLNNTE